MRTGTCREKPGRGEKRSGGSAALELLATDRTSLVLLHVVARLLVAAILHSSVQPRVTVPQRAHRFRDTNSLPGVVLGDTEISAGGIFATPGPPPES